MAAALLAMFGLATYLASRDSVWLSPQAFTLSDLLLVPFLTVLGLSVLAAPHVGVKNGSHLVAYTTVIGVYYFGIKLLCTVEATYARHRYAVHLALAYTVLFAAAFSIFEFLDVNFLRTGISTSIPFPGDVGPYRADFLVFSRARGFSAESGFHALFLNTLGPIGAVTVWRSFGRFAATMFSVIVLLGLAATFSVAGTAFLVVGVVVSLGAYVLDRSAIFVPGRAVLALALVALGVVGLAVTLPSEVWTPVLAKLRLQDSSSGTFRAGVWSAAVMEGMARPILGYGLGSSSEATGTGVLSLFLTLATEAGLVAMVLFLLFVLSVWVTLVRFPPTASAKYAYVLSFVAATLHYAVISDIWYPWYWLLVILIQCDGQLYKEGTCEF
jgi:hypothetical protein